ncbi:MAG: TonB-dependent receptor, partial [Coleofasciculus sp. C2-GNP5-27]
AYGEALIPVVNDTMAVPGVRRFELSIAGRYEDYGVIGSEFVPKFGALWDPVEGLRIRAGYTQAFRVPTIDNLDSATSIFVAGLLNPGNLPDDPRLGNGLVYGASIFAARNPDLEPESAESWTVGLDWVPNFLPELNLSITYFDVDYDNRIQSIAALSVAGSAFPAFNSVLPGRPEYAVLLDTNPNAVALQSLFNDPSTTI